MEAPRVTFGFFGDIGGEDGLPESGELAVRGGAVLGGGRVDTPSPARKGLFRSGLVQGEGLGELEADSEVLSVGGRGEIGTFHKLASSGKSSSSSLYSASSSLMDFLLGCQDPRLIGGFFMAIGAESPLPIGATGLITDLVLGDIV